MSSTSERSTALLIATLVDTLAESDPAIKDRFLKRLGWVHEGMHDRHGVTIEQLGLLMWTKQLIERRTISTGPDKPFYDLYEP